MRDFSWKYFVLSGDVDAYMLYKESLDSFSNETEFMEAAAAGEELRAEQINDQS
ncbi:YqzL family protein [Marinicrinis sediminis]|uniref:YqzL family protein n=1 Tax=Marinicrinis sediminis TaxID=1652465 RepID=A0ABW5RCE2_9BACL